MKNKVLTGTYIVYTNSAKFNQNEVNLCNEDDETLTVSLWKILDNQFSVTLYGFFMT